MRKWWNAFFFMLSVANLCTLHYRFQRHTLFHRKGTPIKNELTSFPFSTVDFFVSFSRCARYWFSWSSDKCVHNFPYLFYNIPVKKKLWIRKMRAYNWLENENVLSTQIWTSQTIVTNNGFKMFRTFYTFLLYNWICFHSTKLTTFMHKIMRF